MLDISSSVVVGLVVLVVLLPVLKVLLVVIKLIYTMLVTYFQFEKKLKNSKSFIAMGLFQSFTSNSRSQTNIASSPLQKQVQIFGNSSDTY